MRSLPALAAPLAVLFASNVALAQTSAAQPAGGVARAEALFTEAKSLRDSGKYPDACAKFAESERLAPGVGVSLYLGDCYDHIGKTASAWSAFRAAERRAREKNDDRARVAAERAKALEPKVSRIVLAVAPSLHRAGVAVTIDGGPPLSPDDYAPGVPADPGDHVVALKLGDRIARAETVHVAAGGARAPIVLGEPPLSRDVFNAKPAAAVAAVPHPPVDTRFAAGVSLALLGVGGIATGAAFLYEKNRSMTDGGPNGSPTYDHGAGAISAVAFAVGGTAFAGVVALYLTAPARRETATITFAPMVLSGGGGASFGAHF